MAANRERTSAIVRRFLGTFLSLLVLSAAVPGIGAAGPKEDVQAAKARVERREKELEAQRTRLANLQAQIADKASELVAAQAELEILRVDLRRTEADLAAAQERIAELQAQLDERAAAAYINSTSADLEFLLASSSLSELTDRLQILEAVSEDDAELSAEIANEAAKLRFKRRELSRLRDKQADLVAEIEIEEQELNDAFDEAKALEADIKNKLASAEKDLRKARIDYREWLEAQRAASARVVKGPGPFKACPVGNPHGVSNSFGAPRVGHLHAGVDIFAPYDTPIYAPFDGQARASSNSLGGYAVYVYGAEGYVYNAHLSRPGLSGSVRAGQVIGYVGTTGNAIGTSPHNHFEWHPNVIPSNVPPSPYGYSVLGDAVNPYPYLMAGVC
jgi:murein DD-endopeptidase MepM/ murein hydrolase activator NlpD